MLPDALPQLIDTVLRLPDLDAAQLRELIQHLPDPQASAQEMLRRGWITQTQFSSLFPQPEPQPTPRATRAVGFGGDDLPPDLDDEIWHLAPIDDDDDADCEQVAWARPPRADDEVFEPKAVAPVRRLSGTASPRQFLWNVVVPPVAGGNEALRQDCDTGTPAMSWMSRSWKGLLILTLIIGSFSAGLQLFGAHSTVPPVAHQEVRQATEPEPARTVVVQPLFVPFNVAKQFDDVLKVIGQSGQSVAPATTAKRK